MSADKEQALNLLSEDERAALAELEEDRKALAAEAAADDEDDEDDADDEDEDEDEDEPATAAEPGAAAEPPKDEKDSAESETQPAPDAAEKVADERREGSPLYSYKLPEDFEEREKAMQDKFAALDDRFDAGEVSRADYQRELRTLNREQMGLESIRQRAEIAADMERQEGERVQAAETAAWAKAADALVKLALKPENGALDYNDDALAAELLAHTQRINAMPEAKGKSKDWVLWRAHRAVAFEHDHVLPAEPGGAAPTAPAAPKAATRRVPPTAALPKTVADLPSTDSKADIGGDFAHLDALSGEKFEAAMERLTPAQREAYLAA